MNGRGANKQSKQIYVGTHIPTHTHTHITIVHILTHTHIHSPGKRDGDMNGEPKHGSFVFVRATDVTLSPLGERIDSLESWVARVMLSLG